MTRLSKGGQYELLFYGTRERIVKQKEGKGPEKNE